MQAYEVELRDFRQESDFERLLRWLEQPHVSRWWGDARRELEDLIQGSPENGAIIMANGIPVGFMCWQRPSREELAAVSLGDLPANLVDVDLLIGESSLLGQGIGPSALLLLRDRLCADPLVSHLGVGTSAYNERAVRAYGKAGFRLFRSFEDSQWGPWLYMVAECPSGERAKSKKRPMK